VASNRGDLQQLIAEQVTYYRAAATEFDDLRLPLPGREELVAALEAFKPAGDVLELACGPGTWTRQLLNHATSVTAIDSSPEMLSIAKTRVEDPRVRWVQADLFSWEPDRCYDVVFLGFWLSHVPPECFDSFWSTVEKSLTAHGRVLFVDDGYRTPDELVEGASSPVIRRRLRDGSAYRAVKVPWEPRDLEDRLGSLGWRITVTQTAGPFYWGTGRFVAH
jgi:demethylmenaquinone methyltransferase/2-methoxy-6-polyprenyl-1,4-benzoquinol methylase